jgi:CarD family transcriptional regulator
VGWNSCDNVVHPQHGPATVGAVTTRDIGGGPVEYIILHVEQNGLTVMVPSADMADSVREPSTVAEANDVFDVLAADAPALPKWQQRRRINSERLATGDVTAVAEVVRDLARLDAARDRPLSHGEKKLYDEARQLLISELAISLGGDEEDLGRQVDQAALKGVVLPAEG